ncbi:hypothetical protein EDD11_001459 [Mortierella claussenii]|nr:hypothetical protein EDD11_001459 [Mortierella claussenii]
MILHASPLSSIAATTTTTSTTAFSTTLLTPSSATSAPTTSSASSSSSITTTAATNTTNISSTIPPSLLSSHISSSDVASKPMLLIQPPVLQHMNNLARHIATQGLVHGIGSDITIQVFEKTYHLHRLVLTQSSFFESMFQGPWKERESDLVNIKFNDPNISLEGFEVAIGRLYGVWTEEEDPRDNLRGSMDKTRSCGSDSINHGEDTKARTTSANEIKFAASANEVPATASAAAGVGDHTISTMLSLRNVLSVLACGAYLGIDVLCEQCTSYIIRTLSTDHISRMVQFSHHSDYYPWSGKIAEACHTFLCRNGYDNPRIRCGQVFETLPAPWLLSVIGSDAFWVPNEWERYKFCREVIHNRRMLRRRRQSLASLPVKSVTGTQQNHEEEEDDDDEEAVFDVLFSTSITYMHMTFEQLQVILHDIDPLTHDRFTRPEVIHEALWQQTELRTLIDRSSKDDGPLDIFDFEDSNVANSTNHQRHQQQRQHHHHHDSNPSNHSHPGLAPSSAEEREDDHLVGRGGKRDWSIPDQDRTLLGDIFSPTQRLEIADAPTLSGVLNSTVPRAKPSPNIRHSLYAPFRFSVEFGDIHLLQDNVRVSSGAVFYAGSCWDVYIQKLPSPKGVQLGVYLHRQSLPDISRGSSTATKRPRPTVPGAYISNSSAPPSASYRNASLPFAMWPAWAFRGNTGENSNSGTGRTEQQDPIFGETYTTSSSASSSSSSFRRISSSWTHHHHQHAPQEIGLGLADIDESNLVSINESFSCYVDKREKVKTWFKIFAASLGPGHTITQFQSSPDDFFVMQSWGWRSSSLCSSNYMPENTSLSPEDDQDLKLLTACSGLKEQVKGGVFTDIDGIMKDMDMARSDTSPSEITAALDAPGCSWQNSDIQGFHFDEDAKDGHDDTGATLSNYKMDTADPCECKCEAQKHFGRHHHHHAPPPLTLKFSIVMGHI